MSEYDPRYERFVELFNAGEYYDSHDVLEDLWIEEGGEEKLYYQGLIQAAVGLLHHHHENLNGAIKLYTAATEKLTRYAPVYLGLDVARLLAEIDRFHAMARREKEDGVPGTLNPKPSLRFPLPAPAGPPEPRPD